MTCHRVIGNIRNARSQFLQTYLHVSPEAQGLVVIRGDVDAKPTRQPLHRTVRTRRIVRENELV